MTPDMLQQMQLIAQLQQQQAAAAAAAAATGGMPMQQQPGQQPMDASAAYATVSFLGCYPGVHSTVHSLNSAAVQFSYGHSLASDPVVCKIATM